MRISDWSSDVCSSDLDRTRGEHPVSSTAQAKRRPIRRALISVYDKAGLLDLATGLHAAGVEIVSTGSTAQRIADAGVPVTRVEEGIGRAVGRGRVCESG